MDRLSSRERRGEIDGEVCAWTPSRDGTCWNVALGSEIAPATSPRAVRPRDVEDPVRVDGNCAIYSDGDSRCVDEVEGAPRLPWSLRPKGTIDPLSDEGVRHRVARESCVLIAGGRLVCDSQDVRNLVDYQEWTFSFAGEMPGLSDVRAFVQEWTHAPRFGDGHGCAIRGDGRVLCWGENLGESLTIGDADRAPRLVPLLR